jgi:hypothetical protein
MASKSKRPVLRRTPKITRRSWSPSQATSLRNASAVFFLGRRRDLLHRPQLADLFIDIQQSIAQFPEALAFGDLALSFGQAGWVGKRPGDGFAIHFACQSRVGAMAGITGLMAMTVRIFTTAPRSRMEPSACPPTGRFGIERRRGGSLSQPKSRACVASSKPAYRCARL